MNYKQVTKALESLEPFNHNGTMKAVNEGLLYRVYSYSTEIARYNQVEGIWYVNPNKYSVTTSKQQNLVNRVIANREDTFELMAGGN